MNDPAHDAIRSYRPGGWYAIFGDHASVLLPESEKARVAALWELVDAGAGFDELLDTLIATGLRSLPGFVLISTLDEPTRIVLRGAARALVALENGESVEVDGGAAATWVERALSSVATLQLVLEEDGEAVDFGIRGGLVRASRVDQPPHAGPSVGGAMTPEPVAAPGPVVPVAGAASPDPLTDDLPHEPVAAASPAASFDEVEVDPVPEVPDMAPTEEPVASQAEGTPESADGDLTDMSEPDVETETHAFPFFNDPEPDEQPQGQQSGQGDELPAEPQWGEVAAGHAYAPPEAPANPFGPGSQNPVDPPMWVPPAPAPEWGAPQVPQSQTWGDIPEADADHDGQTVAGGHNPDQFARQHPGIPGQQPAPNVTAQPVARLVFSSGEAIDVDRAVLVGRAPEARRFTSTDQPRLVTVPSPNQEISSTHLEVRPGSGVDHGSAIVTDMGSTNGTVLTQPGFAPEDLQPGIAVQLLPGSVIDLGDGVTIAVTSI